MNRIKKNYCSFALCFIHKTLKSLQIQILFDDTYHTYTNITNNVQSPFYFWFVIVAGDFHICAKVSDENKNER